MSTVVHQVFGKPNKPTIYYLTGFGGTIKQYKPHILALRLLGFRIVAFAYDKSILASGNPSSLVKALDSIVEYVSKDQKTHKVAGLYGASLGSWLGGNVLVMCGIKSGVFNTGAASIVRVVWDNPNFQDIKAAFVKKGNNRRTLEERWGPYEFTADGRRWAGKRVLIMSSRDDEILDIHEVETNIHSWQKAGDNIEWIASRGLGHERVIKRNMLRFRKASKVLRP